jgi:formamidopyrimidine-DNA glycosylase
MPELPEVETIKRDIEKNLIGHQITDVWYDWAKTLKPDPETFKKAVVGKKFKDIGRRAKLFIFHVDSIPLIAHLKLTGRLLYRNQNDPKDQFTHVVLKLDRGKELRFVDLRKFGWLRVLKDEGELDELLSEFGIEPFTSSFTLEKFASIIQNKGTMIKPLLMDQKQIAGVGNIYSDEALWCAQIHPETPAKNLRAEKIEKLYSCIQKVLKEGITDRGTSVDDYLDLFGRPGNHEQNLQVFRKDGQPCPRCGTTIKKIRVGGRGTHYCPNCQVKQ